MSDLCQLCQYHPKCVGASQREQTFCDSVFLFEIWTENDGAVKRTGDNFQSHHLTQCQDDQTPKTPCFDLLTIKTTEEGSRNPSPEKSVQTLDTSFSLEATANIAVLRVRIAQAVLASLLLQADRFESVHNLQGAISRYIDIRSRDTYS